MGGADSIQGNEPTCLACGYLLTGLPKGQCPECGRDFDPDNSRTIVARRAAFWRRLADRRISRVLHGLFLAGVAWLLLTGSAPAHYVSDTYTAAIYFYVRSTLIVWGAFIVAHLTSRVVLWRLKSWQPRVSWTWLIVPVTLAAFWLLHQHSVVWWARWHLSRGAFERLAATPTSQWRPGLYGVFYVTEIRRLPRGSMLLKVGFPDLYSDWFPYFELASGPWPEYAHPCVEPLSGGWWIHWDNT